VERAPVPPHERTWRHPSELAAGVRAELVAEPATATAKALTVSVGAVTLIALAVVVVSFTPDRAGDRFADRATPSTVASALLSAGRNFMAQLAAADDERPNVTTVAAVSRAAPAPTDAVTVLTDPPIRASFGRVHATLVLVGAPDGTAVVDAGGRLIAVWSIDGGRPRLIPAGELARSPGAAPAVATTLDPD
jgi:hypothetical protein